MKTPEGGCGLMDASLSKNQKLASLRRGIQVLFAVLALTNTTHIWALDDTLFPAKLCVGDSWTWKGNEFLADTPWLSQITEVKTGAVTSLSTPREVPNEKNPMKPRRLVRGADGNLLESGDTKYDPHNQEIAFPLRVGTIWTISHRYNADFGGTIHKTGEAKIVAIEQLSTAAGSIEAYRIQQYGQMSNSSSRDWRASYQSTYWYAPAAKGIIKYSYHHQATRGGSVAREGEITAFKLSACSTQ